MLLTPHYGDAAFLSIAGSPDDVLAPLTRQRRRLVATLTELDDDAWATPSRCEGWTVQDVVAHLVGVDSFWKASVQAGLAGTPTELLAEFDPAATPPLMVEGMRSLEPAQVLELFTSACNGFLESVAELDDAGWGARAESPAGHVTIRLMAAHALWDCWVHERDIVLPLGAIPAEADDEVLTCVRYAAALSPVFALALGHATPGTLAIESSDPPCSLVVEVGDSVSIADGPGPVGAPRLRGSGVELAEALSLRAPLPASTPVEWQELLGGLATLFDSKVETATG